MKNTKKLSPEDIEKAIVSEDYYKLGVKTTVCLLTLRNGFEIIGTSSCVDPDNYDHDIGRGLAKQKAMDEVWYLEGYRLQQSIYEVNK